MLHLWAQHCERAFLEKRFRFCKNALHAFFQEVARIRQEVLYAFFLHAFFNDRLYILPLKTLVLSVYINSPSLQASRRVWSPVSRSRCSLNLGFHWRTLCRQITWSPFLTNGRSVRLFCFTFLTPKNLADLFICFFVSLLGWFWNRVGALLIHPPFAQATF